MEEEYVRNRAAYADAATVCEIAVRNINEITAFLALIYSRAAMGTEAHIIRPPVSHANVGGLWAVISRGERSLYSVSRP